MKVAEVMTPDVDCCTPESSCKEVAIKMRDLNVGVIPICRDAKLLGIVTDRDLVIRGFANNLSSESTVAGLMTDEVVKGTKEMSVEEAADIMAKHQIRRLPVVENDKLIGMVSLGDIAVGDPSNEAGEALENISIPAKPE